MRVRVVLVYFAESDPALLFLPDPRATVIGKQDRNRIARAAMESERASTSGAAAFGANAPAVDGAAAATPDAAAVAPAAAPLAVREALPAMQRAVRSGDMDVVSALQTL